MKKHIFVKFNIEKVVEPLSTPAKNNNEIKKTTTRRGRKITTAIVMVIKKAFKYLHIL